MTDMLQQSRPEVQRNVLHAGFVTSAEVHYDRPALEVDGVTLSYCDLLRRAKAIAATLQRRTPSGGPPFTAVFAHRSTTAFAGVLGALCAGHGYVPLNRTFPAGRSRWMLQSADCRSIVVDSRSEQQLDSVLEGIAHPLLIVLPETKDVRALANRWPEHIILGSDDLDLEDSWTSPAVAMDAVAYLLFTSGSTGAPKGVMVTHRNVTHFIRVVTDRYRITANDRFSQMFDLTFDLSVFDMFVAWQHGACVCCPSEKALFNPSRFICDSQLTVWAAVPSVGVLMKRLGSLKENQYPALRLSVFCGEPLPVDLAASWRDATPGSVLENLYGPTELTVACSSYRWEPDRSPAESELGIVPIGRPLPGMTAMVVDEDLREVLPGCAGELLMSGPQVTPGYWQNDELTARSFVRPPGKDTVFYRTGDRVRRASADGCLTYIGRVDNQIKVHGYRVELAEVESKLREQPGVEAAVALGWPELPTGAGGIAAFLTGNGLDVDAIRTSLRTTLQSYAVPKVIRILPEMPLNSNGKVDRTALRGLLRE